MITYGRRLPTPLLMGIVITLCCGARIDMGVVLVSDGVFDNFYARGDIVLV